MNSFRRRGLLTGFVMVFAVLLASSSLAYINLRRLREQGALIDQTRVVLVELQNLLATVMNSVAGTRGYVLTSEEEYLVGTAQTDAEVSDSLNRLRRLTEDNPAQQPALASLTAAVERRLSLNHDFVRAVREESPEAARRLVMRGDGQRALVAVNECVARMEREEQRLLNKRLTQADTDYRIAVVSSLITGGLGLLMAVAGYALAARDLKLRANESRILAEANELLEHKVHERTAAISRVNQQLRDEVAERDQAERKVRQFAEELLRSNRELDQFAAVASHDLQEPLRKIQAFGDRLAGQWRNDLNEKGREYLDRMMASAGRMRTLIDDLLQFARVSTQKQPAVAVDLGELVREVVGDLEGRLQQTQGTVEVNGLPTITADPMQMRQLLQNLIGNAIKFHRPGVPPVVHISGRLLPGPPAESEDSQLGLQCELVVEDNGIGFESAYTDRIFELFQRLHGRDAYEGTGMGLAICKKIVERHRGKITAASTPGQGSRFQVILPVLDAMFNNQVK